MLGGILVIQIVGHHQVENSIAQILQALIVGPVTIGQLHRLAAVDKCQLVQVDAMGVKPSDAMNKNIKLLILDEKELYE